MKQIKRLFAIDPWKISTTQLDKKNLRLQESLTSIGNGYMGMRGNFEETYSGTTIKVLIWQVSGILIRHVSAGGKTVIQSTLEK